jgi:hypothetical protein
MIRTTGVLNQFWHDSLVDLGFAATSGTQIYYRGDTVFMIENDWGVLRSEWHRASESDAASKPLLGQLGKPGLWKSHLDRESGKSQSVFELPPPVLAAVDPRRQGDEGAQNFRATIAWGLETARGEPIAAWELPARHLVESCLPGGSLTFQAGPIPRQGSLVHEPGRLALQCPVLPRVPADLPVHRRQWLDELLLDGHNHWKMVRIGKTQDNAVLAEVDLSGVPEFLLESLLRTGREALRYAVEGLVRAADFLAEGSASSRALEVHSPRA